MNIGTITIELELDDKSFRMRTMQAGQQVAHMSKQFDGAANSVRRMDKAMTGMLPRLRDVTLTMTLLANGIRTLNHMTFGWQKSIVDASAKIERLKVLLTGMSKEVTKANVARELTHEFNFLIETAQTAPFALNEISNAFVKMKSVGIDPTAGSLRALADAVANFGGDDQIFHRATVAIQQMAGKGVISMEELRQQLGEAVPNAMVQLSQAIGMTMGDMVDTISKGQLTAKPALERLFVQFEQTMGGSSKRMMKTWTGMIQRLSVSWDLFKVRIADTGFFDEAKKSVTEMIELLDKGAFDEAGFAIGNAMAQFIKTLTEIGLWVARNIDLVLNLGKAFAIAFGTGVAVKVIGAIVGGMWALVGAFKAGAGATAAFGVSLKAALGPIFWIASAIAGLISFYVELEDAAMDAADAVINTQGLAATAKNLEKIKEGAAEAVENLSQTTKEVRALGDELAELKNRSERAGNTTGLDALGTAAAAQQQRTLKTTIALKQEEYNRLLKMQTEYQAAIVRFERAQTAARTGGLKLAVRDRIAIEEDSNEEALNMAQKNFISELAIEHKKLDGSLEANEAYWAARLKLTMDKQKIELDLMNATIDEARQNVTDATREAGDPQQLAIMKAVLAEWEKRQSVLRDAHLRAQRLNSNSPLQDAKIPKDTRNPFEKYEGRFIEKITGIKSELAGASKEAGEFDAKLAGAFKYLVDGDKIKPADIQRVRNLISAHSDLKDVLKDMRDAQGELKQSTDSFLDSVLDLSNELNTYRTIAELGFDPSSDAARGLEQSIFKTKQLAGVTGITAVEVERVVALYETLLNLQNRSDFNQIAQGADEELRQTQVGLMRQRDAVDAEYEYQKAQLRARLDSIKSHSAEAVEARRRMYVQLQALNEQYARDSETPMQQMARDWEDATRRMNEASVHWIDQASDAIATMVRTGKADFGSLAESIIQDIIRIQTQAAISGLITKGGFTNLFGGGGAGTPGASAYGAGTPFANGGIMSSAGKIPLHAYSQGGIANSPQLAVFGEGRMNEAYVPLPDGKNIPVNMKGGGTNVEINMINQSGQAVEAQQTGKRFDGNRVILDVVLKAANSPGGFRDSLRGAMK